MMNQRQIKFAEESDEQSDDSHSKEFQSVITKIIKENNSEIQYRNTYKTEIQSVLLPKNIKNKVNNAQILHYSSNSIVLYCQYLEKCSQIIKIVQNQKLLKNQIRFLQKLDHQNIEKVFQTFQSGIRTNYYGLNIYEILKPYNYGFRLSQQQIIHILNQIILTILQLHSKNIVHGDIKSENILITFQNWNNQHRIKQLLCDNSQILRKLYLSNQFKNLKVTLIDFGNSFQINQSQLHQTQENNTLFQNHQNSFIKQIPQQKAEKYFKKNFYGPTQTIIYRSPQSISKRGSKQIDIWGIGHVLFQLLTGQKLMNIIEEQDQLIQVFSNQEEWQKNLEYRIKEYQFVSGFAFFKKIILKCLKLKRQERFSINQLSLQMLQLIQHKNQK